jgi:hypothetical protein
LHARAPSGGSALDFDKVVAGPRPFVRVVRVPPPGLKRMSGREKLPVLQLPDG